MIKISDILLEVTFDDIKNLSYADVKKTFALRKKISQAILNFFPHEDHMVKVEYYGDYVEDEDELTVKELIEYVDKRIDDNVLLNDDISIDPATDKSPTLFIDVGENSFEITSLDDEEFFAENYADRKVKVNSQLSTIKMSDILLEAKGFSLPSLPYAYNALEPHIDAETMEEHHKKHHKGYVTKLNDALKSKAAQNLTIEEVLANVKKYDDKVRNNAGGVFNHTLYFNLLSPNATTSPVGELKKELEKTFGSFAKFKEEFTESGTGRFGSGWVWLSLTREGLKIHSTPNQDNPLMSYSEVKGEPIIGMDVWEHAYYLKHRSQRAKYISDFFKVLDWSKAEENYQRILNKE